MQIPQLTNYILEELERGTPEIEIKQKLFQTHWMPEEIEENYEYALQQAQQLVGQYQTKKKSVKGKRTLFISIVFIIIAIIMTAGAFIYIVVSTYQSEPSVTVIVPNASPSPGMVSEPTLEPLIAIVNPLDRKRDQDRQQIQAALVNFYEENNRYPTRLSELTPNAGASIPRDPETANPYKYEVLTNGQDYKLCVTFSEVGEVCFNRLSQ